MQVSVTRLLEWKLSESVSSAAIMFSSKQLVTYFPIFFRYRLHYVTIQPEAVVVFNAGRPSARGPRLFHTPRTSRVAPNGSITTICLQIL